ncbi:TPA: DUF1024 family protein [Staphylococcus aureus]|nr:DUF1024 family protein [Staphylococcus aureus]
MNNREQIEQSVISASAYNGNDTEGLIKEIEDVYKYKDMWEKLKKDYLETYIQYRNDENRNVIRERHILNFIYAMDLFDGNKDAENVLEKLKHAKYAVYAKGSLVEDVHLSGGTKQGTCWASYTPKEEATILNTWITDDINKTRGVALLVGGNIMEWEDNDNE